MLRTLIDRRRARKLARAKTAGTDVREPEAQEAEHARAVRDAVVAAQRWVRTGGPAWRLGRHSVYRVPWYLMLGEQGAGKSAMLRASGRRPVQRADAHASASKHMPGRWWFDEGSVVFEATLNDSADEEGLRALMLSLKRARRRRPIDGVLVAVSARQLLNEDDAARARRVEAMRAQIDFVYRICRRRVPVYVTVTQCDGIAGFEPFVRELEASALDRPLGILFPVTHVPLGEAWLDRFSQSFESLVRDAQAQLIVRLPADGDPGHAAQVYQFPRSLKALSLPLGRFCHDAFGASPGLYEPVLLRGVNLSAVLNESTGVEKPRHRAVSKPETHAQACFVRGWLNDVVPNERDLARSRETISHARRVRLRAATMLCVALAACMGLAAASSYRRGVADIATTASSATALMRVTHQAVRIDAPRTMLPALDAASGLACGPAWRDANRSWLSVLILDRETRLQSACREAYRGVLRETVRPYLLARLSQVLRDSGAAQAARYEALRVYLMLGDKARYDPTAVLAWLDADAARAGLSAHERSTWHAHAAAWADAARTEPNVSTDASLVARAREQLLMQPEAQRIFEAITPALAAAMPAPLSVAELAGPGAALVFDRRSGGALSDGVPGPYTLEGMARYQALRNTAIEQARRDDWVLGAADARMAAGLAAEVDRLYFARYTEAWDAIIGDVRLRPLPLSDDGAAVVRLMAGPESPLRALLLRAARETSIGAATAVPAAQQAQGWANAARRAIRRWVDASKQPTSTATGSSMRFDNAAAQAIDRHFDALHRLIAADGEAGASALDRVQAQLKEVVVYQQAAGVARANGMPPPADDVLQRLIQNAASFPPPLGGMLEGLGEAGTAAVQAAERVRIEAHWRADVAPFCHAAIDGRYPFVADADRDVTLDDFTRLFAPGGLLDEFFEANLRPYVDTTATPWKWRAQAESAGMSTGSLRAFERAAHIRDAFFPNRNKALTLRFTLTPRRMDQAFSFVSIALGDRMLNFTEPAAQAMKFEWPDHAAEAFARIDSLSAGSTGPGSIETHGAWSLFRLLDRGKLDALTPDRFTLTFSLDDHDIELDLAASSVVNPFVLPALRSFRCPSTM